MRCWELLGCGGIMVNNDQVYFDKVPAESNALENKVANTLNYMTVMMIVVTLGGMKASHCFGGFTEGN